MSRLSDHLWVIVCILLPAEEHCLPSVVQICDLDWSRNRTDEKRTGEPRPLELNGHLRGMFRGHLRGMFRGGVVVGSCL